MTDTLASALVAVQKAMPAIKPDATNPHFRNQYVSLDHLLAKALPVLNANGIALVQLPSHNEVGAPTLITRLVHTSGETLEAAMPLFLPKNDPQGHGSALTYARRYAVAALLGVSDEKDDDGEAASSGGETTQTSSSARTSAPPETPRAPRAPSFGNPAGDAPSDKQIGKIKALCAEISTLPGSTQTPDEREKSLGPILTKQKASETIGKLERLRDNHKAAA